MGLKCLRKITQFDGKWNNLIRKRRHRATTRHIFVQPSNIPLWTQLSYTIMTRVITEKRIKLPLFKLNGDPGAFWFRAVFDKLYRVPWGRRVWSKKGRRVASATDIISAPESKLPHWKHARRCHGKKYDNVLEYLLVKGGKTVLFTLIMFLYSQVNFIVNIFF